MLSLRCADLGLVCRETVEASTTEELVQKAAKHAAGKHGVPALNQTLINYALKMTQGTVERKAAER